MSADTYVEVETKFDVPDDFELPPLGDIEGVAIVAEPIEEQLDAEYYDTADLRLLRHGITLRRRAGGRDEGWHLKIPRTLGERVEVRRPLGSSDSDVPDDLRNLAAAHVRDHDLARVARLRTRRRIHRLLGATGALLAEIADDEVRAETLANDETVWRELEVELVRTDTPIPAAVEERVRAAGARTADASSKLARALASSLPPPQQSPDVDDSSPAGDVVVAYLREQVDALLAVDPGVRVDIEDAVHKMRVAARRLRSALATYRRLLDREVTEPLRDELKWLGGVLGPVRDAEVIRDHLRGEIDAQPDEVVIGPVRGRIDRTMDTEHREAHELAVGELSSTRYFRLLDSLEEVAGGKALSGKRAGKRARKVLAREIGRTHERMRSRLDAALASIGPEDHLLHDVRKAAKRTRYAAESGVGVFGSKATTLAERMEEAQETLGEHQDSVVVRDLLRRLADDAEADDEPSFTYGRLHGLEERRADEAVARFLDAVDHGWASPPSWLS